MKLIVAMALAAVAAPAQPKVAASRWIDSADAARITDTCLALALRSGWKVHVAVLNGHGDLIRFVGMDGASRTSGVFALERHGRCSAPIAPPAKWLRWTRMRTNCSTP